MLNYENYLIYSMSIGYESVSDLINRRKSEGGNLSDEECSQIAKGLLKGMAYLHKEKDIIHRDIKE